MPDVLEEQIAARLRDLGDVTPAELEPPADLEQRVARCRKEARRRRSGTALAIAAGFLVVVAFATVLDGRTGKTPVSVAPAHDPLPAGTVMLGAKGRYITARDASGKILATMVTTTHGEVLDAQITADHKTIFYRVTDDTAPCDKIARADIEGRTSSFVARGRAFAISADGTRLALAGFGDLAAGRCTDGGLAALAVTNLTQGTTTTRNGMPYDDLVWDLGTQTLVGRACPSIAGCELDAWSNLQSAPRSLGGSGAPLIAPGPDGLYRVDRPTASQGWSVSVTAGDLYGGPTRLAELPAEWTVHDVVPTASDVYVVAQPGTDRPPELYRIVDGRPVLVRAADPGVVTPVFPLPR